jgi:hypothetical protein
MQKGGALHSDIDERGLHAGQHTRHLAEHDIADRPPVVRTLDLKFDDDSVLDQSDASFAEVTIDD